MLSAVMMSAIMPLRDIRLNVVYAEWSLYLVLVTLGVFMLSIITFTVPYVVKLIVIMWSVVAPQKLTILNTEKNQKKNKND